MKKIKQLIIGNAKLIEPKIEKKCLKKQLKNKIRNLMNMILPMKSYTSRTVIFLVCTKNYKSRTKIKINNGYIHATAKYGLKGAKINFKKVSVGATENLIIAACMANGKTILNNCASEPEIKDLTNFLVKIGSKIRWIDKRKVEIEGVKKLNNCLQE